MNGEDKIKKNNTPLIIGIIVGVLLLCIIGVVVGISALGGLSYFTFQKRAVEVKEEADEITMKMELQNIQAALENYYMENGDYPDDLDELVGDYIIDVKVTGSEVEYNKTAEKEYELSITLPNGDDYTLSSF